MILFLSLSYSISLTPSKYPTILYSLFLMTVDIRNSRKKATDQGNTGGELEGLGSKSGRQKNRIMKEEKETEGMLSLLDTTAGQFSQDVLRNHREERTPKEVGSSQTHV